MEDKELVTKCKNGEREGFEALISKYHSYVYKYLCKISDNDLIVEDLVQETFIKMIRNIDKFDIKGKAKFSSYLITISKNCYIDYYRKERKRINDIPIEETLNFEGYRKSIDEIVVDKMYKIEIFDAINDLTVDQQIAIKMKYIEDMTIKEIGEILKVEPKTIKSRIHNGMVKLRKSLQGGNHNERD